MDNMLQNSVHASTQSPTILVIDDNPTNLLVVTKYLRAHGFKTPTARSGQIGLQRVKLVKPDIILLDIMMPGIDGFETCRRLKADQETKDIPVIFMTALVDKAKKVSGFDLGAVDYITKPFQQDEVLMRIITHLYMQELRQELHQQTAVSSQAITQLEIINYITQGICHDRNLDVLLIDTINLIQTRFNHYQVQVFVFDENRENLRLTQNTKVGTTSHDAVALNDPSSLVAQAARTEKTIVTDPKPKDTVQAATELRSKSYKQIVIPMIVKDEIVGVFNVQANHKEELMPEDFQVLNTFATHLGLAIYHTQ